jgi:hypothetical protein
MESHAAGKSDFASQGKAVRERNFVDIEEVQLCHSYVNVSQDATIGIGQRAVTFWDRNTAHYNTNQPEGAAARPARSLETKWGVIKHNVGKFCGVWKQVVALNESGTSEQDMIGRALDIYKQRLKEKRSFGYMHCWVILHDIPRWMEGPREEARRVAQKRHRPPATPTQADREEVPTGRAGENMAGAGIVAGFTSSGGTTALSNEEYFRRPAGSKVAKEVALLAKGRDAAIRAQARATENMSAAMREKAQSLNDQLAMQLFTVQASQIIDPDAMEYFNLKRKYELH